MKEIEFKDLKIQVYTDPYEWANEFYEIPENVEFEIDLDRLPETAGFAQIGDKQISLFVRNDCEFLQLLSVVAHEYGHIIEGGFTHNPPEEDEYDELHEQKAEFYERFVVDCYQITQMIFNLK